MAGNTTRSGATQPTPLPGDAVVMIRIRTRPTVFAPLRSIARGCTDTDASRPQVRANGFSPFLRDAGDARHHQYFGARMCTCFAKVHLIATVVAAVTVIACSSAYAQSSLGSMRAQYSSGNPQRGGQASSDSSLSPLLGSPPDYETDYLSGDDTSNSTRSQTSAHDGQTRNTKPPQGARISSLYGAPKDYEDSYSAHFGSQPRKTDGARQMTSYGLAAVEGLSSLDSSNGGRASSGKGTLRQNARRVGIGQAGGGSASGPSMVAPGSSSVTRSDTPGDGDMAASFYRSPW